MGYLTYHLMEQFTDNITGHIMDLLTDHTIDQVTDNITGYIIGFEKVKFSFVHPGSG